MISGKWLHEHEALAALVFIIVSLTLTGLFALLERRHRRK
jgi:hypothetical protein